MANPSLQIGNSNWAIKEDNLLGYSTAGTRFVPQPITMTRASAGTRVNSSGLVETVELLGSELVTNGDFATDSDWTKGTGITISGGSANFTGNANQNINQGTSMVNGVLYKATFSVSNYTSGRISINLGGSTRQGNIEANGDYVFYITSSGAILYFQEDFSLGFVGSIDNVSVKEATIDNLPRVDYTDGTSSLLVEPQRTNLIPYSEDFSDSSWTKTGSVSVSSNSVISPDGTLNGSTITGLTGSGSNDLRFGTSINPASTTYTSSVYLKGSGTIRMQMSNNVDNAGSETITLSSSWVRYDLTHTFNSTTGSLALTLDDSGGTATTYDIWGAQLEEGSYATSYIPTDGSTVTRVQDQYSKTGISNLINSTEGVLFIEMAALSDDGTNRVISLNDGTATNRLMLYFNVSSNVVTVAGIGGVISYTVTDATSFNKMAVRYKTNDITLWVDGQSRGIPITSATIPTFTALKFDSGGGLSPFYGKVKQLQVYKTALTDTELATLTTI